MAIRTSREGGIHGEGTGAGDHDGDGDGDGKKVILDAFTLLLAAPIGKESKLAVNHEYGDEHVAEDAEGGDAAEKADDQAEASEKFGHDGEKSQGREDSHH